MATLKPDISVGNHMISSAIWNKAQVNLQVLIYSKLHEKDHVITYL